MSYVRLKHALSKIALDAIAHPGRARTVTALAAYARMSAGTSVRLADIAGSMGMSPEGVRRLLVETGLFTPEDGGRGIALAPACRPFVPYFSRQVGRLGDALHLLEAPRPAGVHPDIWRASALFNAGLFFECHEYLEEIWREAGEPARTFLHGLVQAAAGCYHFEKDNLHGARTLIGKAIAKLRPYAPTALGLDVASLLAGLERVAVAAEATPPGRARDRSELPVMHLVESPGRAPVTQDGPAGRPPALRAAARSRRSRRAL